MGVPASDVGYTSATTGRGVHEVHKWHVVALGENVSFDLNIIESRGPGTVVELEMFQYHE
jgi:hypothetical protein